MKRLAIACFMLLAYSNAMSQPAADCESDCPPDTAKTTWPDQTRNVISNRADGLVRWLDGFFGEINQDSESATTFIRLRSTGYWREGSNGDYDVRLRGKVDLENLDRRLSLVFSDQDGDDTADQTGDIGNQQADSTNIALQFLNYESEHHRVNYRLGIRSSLRPKAEIRYRYRLPFAKNDLFRVVQRFRYRGEDGFELLSRYEHDHVLSSSRLLQTVLFTNYGEQSAGVEWQLSTVVSKRLDERRALRYILSTSGHTRPDYLTTSYGSAVNYRQAVYKDWLFIEAEPGFFWNKSSPDIDRDGAWQFTGRLEILFD